MMETGMCYAINQGDNLVMTLFIINLGCVVLLSIVNIYLEQRQLREAWQRLLSLSSWPASTFLRTIASFEMSLANFRCYRQVSNCSIVDGTAEKCFLLLFSSVWPVILSITIEVAFWKITIEPQVLRRSAKIRCLERRKKEKIDVLCSLGSCGIGATDGGEKGVWFFVMREICYIIWLLISFET